MHVSVREPHRCHVLHFAVAGQDARAESLVHPALPHNAKLVAGWAASSSVVEPHS